MDYQVAFNIILGVAGALGMWIMRSMASNIERLDKDVRDVPEKYLPKNDFQSAMHDLKEDMVAGFNRVEKNFDAVFNRLDGKEDKSASIGARRD